MNLTIVKSVMKSMTAIAFGIFALLAVSCANDKTAEMKDEIAAAYAEATENINNAQDEDAAKQVSEQLQAKISEIQAKYKDVVINLTEEEKYSLSSFYKEQRDKLYNNASDAGKVLIDGISSATNDAFAATVDNAYNAATDAKDAVEQAKSNAENAVDSVKSAVENVKKEAKETVEAVKNNAKQSVEDAKASAKDAANKKIDEEQTKINNAVNEAAQKTNEKINKEITKALKR